MTQEPHDTTTTTAAISTFKKPMEERTHPSSTISFGH
jgi:hypothetical protein